ncbi:MAG: hypothetical protein JWN60_939 [Acidobacteria bacterium]|jgi:hypothetical protein|nr:hypothetical protein [Acidobacteriota bacterium]
MSLEKIIDEMIKKAIADGEFDNLKNAGKPLNFDEYFATPENLRSGVTLLKNNEFVPEEVELLRETGMLREKLKNCTDENEKRALNKKLNEKTLALDMMLERNKRRR